ncbi:hypothetical protein CPB84DRAFT_1769906, partial [Gymnopilus junonius]
MQHTKIYSLFFYLNCKFFSLQKFQHFLHYIFYYRSNIITLQLAARSQPKVGDERPA